MGDRIQSGGGVNFVRKPIVIGCVNSGAADGCVSRDHRAVVIAVDDDRSVVNQNLLHPLDDIPAGAAVKGGGELVISGDLFLIFIAAVIGA